MAGEHIVFTNGCFDILHAGHVQYLTQAKLLGDVLIVGVNSDDSVRRLKGELRPINTEQDRMLVLDALKAIDYVCIFDEDTPIELITLFAPDVLVKGGDYSHSTIVGAEFVTDRGGDVVTIPLLQGRSTTAILEKAKLADHKL